jgi:hypothetical protein
VETHGSVILVAKQYAGREDTFTDTVQKFLTFYGGICTCLNLAAAVTLAGNLVIMLLCNN